MSKKVLYLDIGIFVAHYHKNDSHNKHQRVISCLKKLNKTDIKLVTSDFTFTEFVRVMNRLSITSMERIYQLVGEFTRLEKIGKKYHFKIIEAKEKGSKHYSFNDFFVGLQVIILKNPSIGIADSIHIQIMKNNKIKNILTFDTNDGLSSVADINAINPDDIDDFINE